MARIRWLRPSWLRILGGLPSATVVTAEFDPLRDEGRAYAAGLEHAGVDVELLEYADTIHGFFWMAGYLEQAAHVASAIGVALHWAD